MWYSGKADCLPEDAGYFPEYLDKLEGHFDCLIESGKVMASGYLLTRNNKIFAHRTSGKLAYDQPESAFKPESLRRMASITKVFTATAIMQLIEDGKICLEQIISTILPEFNTPIHKDIQIFHLLTHSSGIVAEPGYFNEPYQRRIYNEIENNPDWIKAILQGPLQSKPGECWNYCSMGFNILGEIIERKSGMGFEDYILSRIVRPLGMNDTYFQVPEELEKEVCVMDNWERNMVIRKAGFSTNKNLPSSGILSTLMDMSRFGNMMLNNGTLDGIRILSRKSVESMIMYQLKGAFGFSWGRKDPDWKVGLCWSYSGDKSLASQETYNHEGYGSSALYIDPSEQLVAVYIAVNYGIWSMDSVVAPRNIIWAGLK